MKDSLHRIHRASFPFLFVCEPVLLSSVLPVSIGTVSVLVSSSGKGDLFCFDPCRLWIMKHPSVSENNIELECFGQVP